MKLIEKRDELRSKQLRFEKLAEYYRDAADSLENSINMQQKADGALAELNMPGTLMYNGEQEQTENMKPWPPQTATGIKGPVSNESVGETPREVAAPRTTIGAAADTETKAEGQIPST